MATEPPQDSITSDNGNKLWKLIELCDKLSKYGTNENTNTAVMAAEVSQEPQIQTRRLSDEKTLEFVELCRKEECLWNAASADYLNRDKRVLAAQKIAYILNVDNFDYKNVLTKFKSMKKFYIREVERAAFRYKPRVSWFKNMDAFLRPHPADLRAVNDHYELVKIKDPINQKVAENSRTETLLHYQSNIQDQEELDSDYEVHEGTRKRSRKMSEENVKKRRCDDDHVQQHQQTQSALKDISVQLQTFSAKTADIGDYYDSFGKYVAAFLRSMPAEKALSLQPKIVSVMAMGGIEGQGTAGSPSIG